MSALWRTGFLLGVMRFSSPSGEECVQVIIGEPVLLPCIYDGALPLSALNFSAEWRRANDVVHRSVWGGGSQDKWTVSSRNSTRVSETAPQTGDFSLQLSMVVAADSNTYSLYLTFPGGNHSSPVCTVCLWTAASFSFPLLLREDAEEGDETRFLCHSRGGFPKPAVRWRINETVRPPEGSVWTDFALLPESQLYNITSLLVVNISQDVSVSCSIENPSMNETLTSISNGVQPSPVVGRATEALWVFSTALCVVVSAMVLAAIAYQIQQDRAHKDQNTEMGVRESFEDEPETWMVKEEVMDPLTETNL
ncbi:ICOS ligand-like [Osmerus eperlanus]|uniref:ICOS ligand-like n=1 Tax=Osmerus eperlanus TaxID=29151 RepID=UPI002E0E436F